MPVFWTIVDVALVFAAVLGTGFLITGAVSRFICNLPDSRPKVVVELGMHLLAAVLGVFILGRAALEGGGLFVPFEGGPQATLFWFGWLGLSLTVFTAYTLIALHRLVRGPRTHPGVSVRTESVSFTPASVPPLPRVNQLFDLERVSVEIRIPGLDRRLDGLTVGHLTDFHLGKVCTQDFIRHAVDRLLETEPDLIAVTGDFVNFPRFLDPCFEALESVRAPLGVYAVRGNHDYWVGAEDIERRIVERGFTLLHDRGVQLEWNGARFLLAGIESPWNEAGIPFDFIPTDPSLLKIVLSHTPDEFPRLLKNNPHLVLSGHTHGGQIRIPFFGAVVVPSNYGRKYESGFYEEGESRLYVSRGIGCHPPIRTLCKPEVTVFRIVGCEP